MTSKYSITFIDYLIPGKHIESINYYFEIILLLIASSWPSKNHQQQFSPQSKIAISVVQNPATDEDDDDNFLVTP
jgi:hypothetical protein